MDLKNLTPAPWIVHEDEASGAVYIPEKLGGFPMLCAELDDSDPHATALEFAALARNAFDVMERRHIYPMRVQTGWSVWCTTPHGWPACVFGVVQTEYRFKPATWPGPWADPFTALIEADKWYRENVEA